MQHSGMDWDMLAAASEAEKLDFSVELTALIL